MYPPCAAIVESCQYPQLSTLGNELIEALECLKSWYKVEGSDVRDVRARGAGA
jgi:hypothetical protein